MNPSPKRPTPPTQRQIAIETGVSRETVSHILGGSKGHLYSEETSRKVREAAARIGYHPNRSARTIRNGRSNLVGIIQAGGSLELARRAHLHLAEELHARGFDSVSVALPHNPQRIISDMIQSRVEGVIVSFMSGQFGRTDAELFRKAGIPIVSVYGDENAGVPTVRDDLCSGYVHLMEHLKRVGHRRFLLLIGSGGASPALARVAGFERAMKRFGPVMRLSSGDFLAQWPALSRKTEGKRCGFIVSVDPALCGGQLSEAHYHFAKALFSATALPDACLCSNDQKAFGLFAAALEMGVKIPGDMAVTGTDNDHFGSFPAFGLTTLHLDVERACGTAVAHLSALIQNEAGHRNDLLFQPSLILRTSCGRAIPPGASRQEIVPLSPLSKKHTHP